MELENQTIEQLEQRYRNAVVKKHQVNEEDIEEVNLADGGAYIQVWLWIPKESI